MWLRFLAVALLVVRGSEIASAILSDLMSTNQMLAIKFAETKLTEDPDIFGIRILYYVPVLLSKRAFEVLKLVRSKYWLIFKNDSEFQSSRNRVREYFCSVPPIQSQIDTLFDLNEIPINSLPVLLKIWSQSIEQTQIILPEDIFKAVLMPMLSLSSIVALSQTCHFFRDIINPVLIHNYKEHTRENSKLVWKYSIRKLWKRYGRYDPESDQAMDLREFMNRNPMIRRLRRSIFGDSSPLPASLITCSPIEYFMHDELDADILRILIKRYPMDMLAHMDAGQFALVWILGYPDSLLRTILKRIDRVSREMLLFVISDVSLEESLVDLVINRYPVYNTLEIDLILTKVLKARLLETIIDNYQPGALHFFKTNQIIHLIQCRISMAHLKWILRKHQVDLSNENVLIELMNQRLPSKYLIRNIREGNYYSPKVLETALLNDYDEDMLSLLIACARNNLQTEPSVNYYSSSDDSDYDIKGLIIEWIYSKFK